MSIELRPARSLPVAELAALFTRTYEDYFVPMQVDEATLEFLVRTFDLDLDAGLVAFAGGDPVGLVNLGVRGDRGWIGGLGVVPEARRQGLGRALMEAVHEQACSRGIEEISLEVIEANEPAFRLYEDLGYEGLRWLEIGSLEAAPGEEPAEEDWRDVHERIRSARRTREPWQRDDATLLHYDDLRGLTTETGAAVFRVAAESRVVLMQFAGDEQAARHVLAALRTLGSVSLLNIPEDDPAATALRDMGTVALRQREMVLTLATSAAGSTA
jgi:ribosomal protein S18 acetylase RimI-like enzyme